MNSSKTVGSAPFIVRSKGKVLETRRGRAEGERRKERRGDNKGTREEREDRWEVGRRERRKDSEIEESVIERGYRE